MYNLTFGKSYITSDPIYAQFVPSRTEVRISAINLHAEDGSGKDISLAEFIRVYNARD